VNYRELLKKVLKSIKSGKLHVAVRVILLVFLLAFSVVSIYDISKYFLYQKGQLTVVRRNLKWGFDWKKKSAWISSDYLSIESPRFDIELANLKIELNLLDSVRNFSLVINNLEFSDGKLWISNVKKGKREGSFLPKLPLKINRLKVQKFAFLSGDTAIMVRELSLSEKSLTLGGISGKLFNRKFQALPFSGYYSKGRLVVPSIQLVLGNATATGKAEIYGSGKLNAAFKLRSKSASGEILISKNNAKVSISWIVSFNGIRTSGKGTVLLSNKAIEILEASGVLDGLNFEGKGFLTKTEIDIKGTLRGTFKYKSLSISGLKSRFSLGGNFESPIFKILGTVKELNSNLSNVKDLWFKYVWSKNLSRIDFSSRQISGVVAAKPSFVRGNLNFYEFNIKSLKPLSKYAKYQKWIPKATFSGNLRFTKKRDVLDFKANFSFASFKFSGFKGQGSLFAVGRNNEVKFTASVYNDREKIKVKGKLDLSKFRLNSKWEFKNVELSEFTFLRKLGLEGKVSGNGSLNGNIKNPSGEFTTYSKELKVWNVPLKDISGKVAVSDFWLEVKASNPEVTLRELRVFLKKPHAFSLRVEVSSVPAAKIVKVAEGFKVKFPFKLSGNVSGTLDLEAKNPKQKETYFGTVRISEFYGKFSYGDFLGLVSFNGTVSLSGSDRIVELQGRLSRGTFKGQRIEGAAFSLKTRKDSLALSFKGLKLFLPIGNVSEGKISYSFKNGELKADFKTEVAKSFSFGVLKSSLSFSVFGVADKLVVKLGGNLSLKSKFVSQPINLAVKGKLQEPQNFGIIEIGNGQTNLKVILNGRSAQAVGSFRNLQFNYKLAKVTVNFGFINLNLNNLTGTIAIPTFRVEPQKFYPLYSVSGIYVNLKEGKPEVSEFTLSYLDGWLKVYDVSLQGPKPISGRLEADLGTKGLIYLLKINEIVPYARNSLHVNGKFSYGEKLSYVLNVKSNQVEIKSKYLLNKATVKYLNLQVENGKIKNLRSVIESETGNVEVLSKGSSISITFSSFPVGELGKWKGLISGNVKFANNVISGEVNVSKARLIVKKIERALLEPPQTEFPMKINVNVFFSEPVRLEGKLFWMKLIPELKLATRNRKLVISGTFLIPEGEINYMGKTFKVVYGSGEIRNLQELKGKVSLIASAHISGYFVYMKIQGKLKSPTVFLTSDPPLTRSQILNLVMTGASPEEIESSSETFPAVQVAYYATSSFFKPVEEQFRKTLNLERFSIEPYITKYGETVAKLTLVKKLSERIKLTGYGTTGQNPEYGGSAKYRIGGKYYLEVRYNSYYGQEAGIGVEVNRK